jgi:hypothetical protein
METLVHLDLLVFRGALRRTQVDGTWCYSADGSGKQTDDQ